jgi:hypothetical protein
LYRENPNTRIKVIQLPSHGWFGENMSKICT